MPGIYRPPFGGSGPTQGRQCDAGSIPLRRRTSPSGHPRLPHHAFFTAPLQAARGREGPASTWCCRRSCRRLRLGTARRLDHHRRMGHRHGDAAVQRPQPSAVGKHLRPKAAPLEAVRSRLPMAFRTCAQEVPALEPPDRSRSSRNTSRTFFSSELSHPHGAPGGPRPHQGRRPPGVPASIWQLHEVRELAKDTDATTVATYRCRWPDA